MKKTPVALLAGLALIAAGCQATSPAEQSPTSGAAATPLTGDAPAGFEQYYSQSIDFAPCSAEQVTADLMPTPTDLQKYQCATIKAPLNWDDPDSESINLAIARYSPKGSAAGRRLLFFNLGGPGGDAVNSFSLFNEELVPEDIFADYDVMALDPRGTGQSTPVSCWDDAGRDQFFAEDTPVEEGATTEQIIADANKEVATIGAGCLERSGEVLGFIDTDSSARDFDMLRALMGQEQMDYLGYSYGTLLGATFAELFPGHVGRFVLDGMLDPAYDINQVTALQAGGMEEALYHWIETCQAGTDCPLSGSLEDGKQQMIDFFASVAKSPLETNDSARPLTESLARTGVIGSLYSVESYSLLNMGMEEALNGSGTVLLALADYYNGRSADGTYSNMQDAFISINSLDYEPVGTPDEWQAQAEKLKEDFPVFGKDFGFASAGLDAWPVKSRAVRSAVTAAGAPPILIVGTLHDPATPYAMAESMAKSLENGVLLTYDGWGHGAFRQGGSKCVAKAVNGYLLDGEMPADGTTCE